MNKKLKVYIAGPYTQGDVVVNVRKAMDAAEELFKIGYIPFIPHLTHFQHMVHPHEYQHWLDYDIEWLKCCDILLRLPGASSGADKEVEVAKNRDMPIFYSLFEVQQFKNGNLFDEFFETKFKWEHVNSIGFSKLIWSDYCKFKLDTDASRQIQ